MVKQKNLSSYRDDMYSQSFLISYIICNMFYDCANDYTVYGPAGHYNK